MRHDAILNRAICLVVLSHEYKAAEVRYSAYYIKVVVAYMRGPKNRACPGAKAVNMTRAIEEGIYSSRSFIY